MVKKESMTNTILRNLREQIVSCVYPAGEIITEAEVSASFGSSKTPAREALNYLCIEGYLEKMPHKGYLVKAISISDVKNLFQYRYILESASAEWAARHATQNDIQVLESFCPDLEQMSREELDQHYYQYNYAFHLGLARLTHNPYIETAVHNTLDQLRRALTLDQHSNPKEALQGHIEMVQVIRDHDPERARQMMQEHLQQAQTRIYIQEINIK